MDLLEKVVREAIEPALALLPARMDSVAARREMLAIGLQESRLIHQRQIRGPARGLWQFELGGGVAGVLRHPASRPHAVAVCHALGVRPTPPAVYHALEGLDDRLDAAFARLLLWTDPAPLPAAHDAEGGWQYYVRNWRPGKPHRQTWDAFWAQAVECVG